MKLSFLCGASCAALTTYTVFALVTVVLSILLGCRFEELVAFELYTALAGMASMLAGLCLGAQVHYACELYAGRRK